MVIYIFTTPFTLSLLAVMVPTLLYNLGYTVWFYVALGALLVALIVLFVIQFFTVEDVVQGMDAGAQNPSFDSVSSFYDYLIAALSSTWQRMYDIPWAQQRVCTHAPLCQCRDELDRQAAQCAHDKQDLAQSVVYYKDLLNESVLCEADLATQITKLQVERDNYRYMAELPRTDNSTHSYPWGLPPPQPDLVGALDDARSKIGHLLAEADDLKAASRKELAVWRSKVDELQIQVNYSHGAGQDRSLTQDELENTKARVRALERELKDMTFTASMLRQELAKEKETHSEKCQNEAVCQREILALQVTCDKYRHYQTENDLLARDAAKRWKGLDDNAVANLTIRSFLEETTLTLMCLQGLGTPGLNTTDLQVEMVRRGVAEDAKYKNRLERELERLGGNVTDVRVGLESTRPQDWKTEMLTYEQNHCRVFPIYGKIVQAVIELSNMLQRVAPNQLPFWRPEPARNDATTAEDGKPMGDLQLAQMLSRSNEFINPRATHESSLVQKLTVAECQRWYNRGVQLQAILTGLCNTPDFVQKRPAEEFTHLTKVIVPQTEFVLKQTLHDVLMDVCLLKRDDTEKEPTSREKKRFEIYTAMQHSITVITKSILANQRKPPAWGPPIQNSMTPITRADDLATHLVVHEIINLENRIRQLRQFMNDFQMPGTRFGPVQSEIQGDNGRYRQMWNDAVAALSWAELTLIYWTVWKAQKPVQQIGDDGIPVMNAKGEPVFKPRPDTDPKMMPLNYDDFLLNIKMKNAEVKEKKDKWPEDHVPVAYFNPALGPMIKFVPKSELKAKENEKGKDDKDKINDGEGNNAAKTKAREDYNNNNQRVIQLTNHVREWGLSGFINLPQVKQLAKNASLATIDKGIIDQQSDIKMLCNMISKAGRTIPKWPKNGGLMRPR